MWDMLFSLLGGDSLQKEGLAALSDNKYLNAAGQMTGIDQYKNLWDAMNSGRNFFHGSTDEQGRFQPSAFGQILSVGTNRPVLNTNLGLPQFYR